MKKSLKKLIPISIVILIPFFIPRVIQIKNIECESQFGICHDELKLTSDTHEVMQSLQTTNLWSSKKKIKELLDKQVIIEDYSIRYIFPDTLKVNLILRKPYFALNNFLIDKNGVVVSKSEDINLPQVLDPDVSKNIGDKVNSNELFTLKIMQGLFYSFKSRVGEVKNDSLVVALPNGLTVIFPLGSNDNQDLEYYLGAVRLVVTKIEAEKDKNFRELDLRFSNPVLR